MVDLGISFPDESMPGVDVVLPDLQFIESRKDKLEAIILTHAHEDHFGAIQYLWKRLSVPVYGTAFTLALLRRKLAESRLDYKIPLHEIDFNVTYDFGPISVELDELRWIENPIRSAWYESSHPIVDLHLQFSPQTVPASILVIRLISALLPLLLPEPVKLHADFRSTAWPQVHPLHHVAPILKLLRSILGFAIVDLPFNTQRYC